MKKAGTWCLAILICLFCLAVLTGAVWGLCCLGLPLWSAILIVVGASVGLTVMVFVAIIMYEFSDLD